VATVGWLTFTIQLNAAPFILDPHLPVAGILANADNMLAWAKYAPLFALAANHDNNATEYKEIKSEFESEAEKLERKIDEPTTFGFRNERTNWFLMRPFAKPAQILCSSGPHGQTTDTRFNTFRKPRFFRIFISNHKI